MTEPNTPIVNYSRRQFLGALGAGTVATAGLTRPVAAQETPVVKMGNNYFDPIGLHVDPGTTVRFEVAAGTHSSTAHENRIPSDASAFDSGVISSGGLEHTFEEPGTYDYYCIPHRSVGMVGRIVVGSPGGPSEENPIPDGQPGDPRVRHYGEPSGDIASVRTRAGCRLYDRTSRASRSSYRRRRACSRPPARSLADFIDDHTVEFRRSDTGHSL